MSEAGLKDVLPVLGNWGKKVVVVCMNKHNYKTVYMDTDKMNTYIPQEKT